jgi:hypothetical protein
VLRWARRARTINDESTIASPRSSAIVRKALQFGVALCPINRRPTNRLRQVRAVLRFTRGARVFVASDAALKPLSAHWESVCAVFRPRAQNFSMSRPGAESAIFFSWLINDPSLCRRSGMRTRNTIPKFRRYDTRNEIVAFFYGASRARMSCAIASFDFTQWSRTRRL